MDEIRLFSMLISDKKLMDCAFSYLGEKLDFIKGDDRGHFGMGFFYEGEFLQKKQPILFITTLKELLSGVRSNQIFLYFNKNPSYTFKTELIQPYRYRNWLSILKTDLNLTKKTTEDIISIIPSYISKSLKSNSAEELIFNLFLYSLHEAGKLDTMIFHQEYGIDAFRGTFEKLQKILADTEILELPEIVWMLSNGQYHYAISTKENSLYFNYSVGIEKCLKCSDLKNTIEKDKKIISHLNFRIFTLISKNYSIPEGYNEVPPLSLIITSEYVEKPQIIKIL